MIPARWRDDGFEAEVLACRSRRTKLLITINGAPDEIVQDVHGWGGMIFHDVTTIRHRSALGTCRRGFQA
jgi:nitronate monooxygenase